ncbi:MAG: hypothetical protein ABI718_02060 [Acidobacteriota bacterium]
MTARRIAEWSPSRAYLSFYKLLGFLFLRSKVSDPEEGDRTELLAFVPQQNSFEAFSLGGIYYVFALIFLETGLQRFSGLPAVAMILLLPVVAFATFFVLEIFMLVIIIPVSRVRSIHNARAYDTRRVSHWVFVAVYTWISCILIRQEATVAWAGYCWLALVGLNIVASALVFMLQKPIAAVDLRFRGDSLFEN